MALNFINPQTQKRGKRWEENRSKGRKYMLRAHSAAWFPKRTLHYLQITNVCAMRVFWNLLHSTRRNCKKCRPVISARHPTILDKWNSIIVYTLLKNERSFCTTLAMINEKGSCLEYTL